VPKPKEGEVLVKVSATPLNPSDIALLLGPANVASARASQRDGLPVITADIPAAELGAIAGRVGKPQIVGGEGSGVVVQAGSAPAAQALMGKTVMLRAGANATQYRCVPAEACVPFPDGADPADVASAWVNPMTSLAFVEHARLEGYKTIVHTAAASNLGQMLVRICAKDGVPLINIVRNDAHVKLLKSIGATCVINSSAPTYMEDLIAELAKATGPIVAFDAIGGGDSASQILAAMEAAASRNMKTYSRYGSNVHKQVYIYGTLDPRPTLINRTFGYGWGLAGFLVMSFLGKAGPDIEAKMRKRVADELTTTFKSTFSHQISLTEALSVDVLKAYAAKRTGEKYLIRP
jgi:NADPH:quinone reductase-like Zn-dependent oxidoreductase